MAQGGYPQIKENVWKVKAKHPLYHDKCFAVKLFKCDNKKKKIRKRLS